MNYVKWIYWITVADNARTFFMWFITMFTIISIIATVAYLFCIGSESENGGQTEDDKAGQKMARKWMWWGYPFMILFWMLYILTPNKKDAMLIIAGGQTLNFLTTDSSAKKIPHELTTFVVDGLKSMAKDVQVDLGISNAKDKILEEAKQMTGQQVIERMGVDSNFAKIILNK